MRRSLRTGTLALFLCATVAVSSACYGSFQMTRSIHEWNGEVTNNKFANWLLFVGLVVVPVYEVSLLVDGVVLNSVEFWTGSNPVASDRLAVDRAADGTLRVARGDRELELRPRPSGAVDVYEDGEHRGRVVRHDDGSISLYGPDGERLHHIDAEAARARHAAMAP